MSRAKPKRKAPAAPLVTVTRSPANPLEQRTDADLLHEYLEDLVQQVGHVLAKPDALAESTAAARRVAVDRRRAVAFVATLNAGQVAELWNVVRLVLEAEGMAANELWARSVAAGAGSIIGGREGAELSHKPAAEREAVRNQWRARFAELRSKFPNDKKATLGGLLESETGKPWRTLRRYIKQR